jgi:hypothetical protein
MPRQRSLSPSKDCYVRRKGHGKKVADKSDKCLVFIYIGTCRSWAQCDHGILHKSSNGKFVTAHHSLQKQCCRQTARYHQLHRIDSSPTYQTPKHLRGVSPSDKGRYRPETNFISHRGRIGHKLTVGAVQAESQSTGEKGAGASDHEESLLNVSLSGRSVEDAQDPSMNTAMSDHLGWQDKYGDVGVIN